MSDTSYLENFDYYIDEIKKLVMEIQDLHEAGSGLVSHKLIEALQRIAEAEECIQGGWEDEAGEDW